MINIERDSEGKWPTWAFLPSMGAYGLSKEQLDLLEKVSSENSKNKQETPLTEFCGGVILMAGNLVRCQMHSKHNGPHFSRHDFGRYGKEDVTWNDEDSSKSPLSSHTT